MNTSTRLKTGSIPVEEALRTLTDGLGQADSARAAAYERLEQMRKAKASLLIRQSDLLAQKLGKSHPRVIALRSQAQASQQMSRDLQAAAVQTATAVPDVKPEGFTVHGFARTTTRDPVAQAIVAIYDRKGNLRRDFNHAITDRNGYFVLATDRIILCGDVTPKENETPLQVSLELRVFDMNRKPLGEGISLTAQAGQFAFEEILIENKPPFGQQPPDSVTSARRNPSSNVNRQALRKVKPTPTGKMKKRKG